ncbi:MAG TPA: MinD/ParA family protein [Oscillospiraceae bacterium]|nr:MinD/ParA family protein [Oscillospiraceae bacterium]
MLDQAAKLRELINDRRMISKQIVSPKEQIVKDARIICITSGKGGVGKTNFTINLAIELSKLGNRVVIIDADLGLANIDVVLGIIPKYTLFDVIHNDRSIEEIMVTGPNDIKIISGASGITEFVDIPSSCIQQLIEKFYSINNYADIILIDTGAGLSDSVLSFVLAAQEVIIVTTPEPTSITDAYAMIKVINLRDKNKEIKIMINRIGNITEGNIAFEKLKNAVKRFLSMDLHKLGYVFEDGSVVKSVKKQVPFTVEYPDSIASKSIKNIAIRLINDTGSYIENDRGFDGFFRKVFNFFR